MPKPPAVTDAEFEVVEAPHGMTWKEYSRQKRQEAKDAKKRVDDLRRAVLRPYQVRANVRYLLFLAVAIPCMIVVIKVAGVIWFAVHRDPYADIAIRAPGSAPIEIQPVPPAYRHDH